MAALFLRSRLLPFSIAGIKISVLISCTRFGRFFLDTYVRIFEVVALCPHLVTIAWASEPHNNRSWLPMALPTKTLDLEVVGDYLTDTTRVVFLAGFRNFVKDVPTSAVYFLSDQLVILVGLLLLAFCYAVKGIFLAFLCKFN